MHDGEKHHLLELAEAVMCHGNEYNVIIIRKVSAHRATIAVASEPGAAQERIRPPPGSQKFLARAVRLCGLVLRTERLLQSVEAPAVARMILQLRTVDPLRIGGPLQLEVQGTEPVAGGERKRLRLVVPQRVLGLDGALEHGDRVVRLAIVTEQLSAQNSGGDAEQALR